MAYQTTALDNMFSQTLPKRRGTAESRATFNAGRITIKRHVEGCRAAAPRQSRIARLTGRG